MSTQHTTSGITVTEYDGPDTEDITITAVPDAAIDQWERLADAYASGEACPGCMFYERGTNPFTGTRWRECSALVPEHCPVVNGHSIAAALRRQAS